MIGNPENTFIVLLFFVVLLMYIRNHYYFWFQWMNIHVINHFFAQSFNFTIWIFRTCLITARLFDEKLRGVICKQCVHTMSVINYVIYIDVKQQKTLD